MPTNYQEPIEKEDIDTERKFREAEADNSAGISPESAEQKIIQEGEKPEEIPPSSVPEKEISPGAEKEAGLGEKQEEKISEKIETARKTIGTQKPAAQTSVSDDAGAISQITEYEKKVDKLIELALQKGPEHAIKVAQHMDKGKAVSEMDNYTLDEIHDRLLEEELRNQLIQKGLLKEL